MNLLSDLINRLSPSATLAMSQKSAELKDRLYSDGYAGRPRRSLYGKGRHPRGRLYFRSLSRVCLRGRGIRKVQKAF